MSKKILRSDPARKSKSILVRIRESELAAFAAKLKREGRKRQHFFDEVIRAYLEGKIK